MTYELANPVLISHVEQTDGTNIWSLVGESTGIDSVASWEVVYFSFVFMIKQKDNTAVDSMRIYVKDDGVSKVSFYLYFKYLAGNLQAMVGTYDWPGTTYASGTFSNINFDQYYYFEGYILMDYLVTNTWGVYANLYDTPNKTTLIDSCSDTGNGGLITGINEAAAYVNLIASSYSQGDTTKFLFGPVIYGRYQYSSSAIPSYIPLEADNAFKVMGNELNWPTAFVLNDTDEYFQTQEDLEVDYDLGDSTVQDTETGISFGDYFDDMFTTLADNLDNVLTLGNMTVNLKGILSPLNDPLNKILALVNDGFELSTDAIISVFKALLESGTWIIEQLHTGLKDLVDDEINPILSWIVDSLDTTASVVEGKLKYFIRWIMNQIRGIIYVTANTSGSYWEPGDFLINIAESLINDLNFLYEPWTGSSLDDIKDLGSLNFRIWKEWHVYIGDLAGPQFTLKLPFLSPAINDRVVPYSTNIPHSGVPNIISGLTSGFTIGDLLAGSQFYGAIALIAYFAPSLFKTALNSISTFTPTKSKINAIYDTIVSGDDYSGSQLETSMDSIESTIDDIESAQSSNSTNILSIITKANSLISTLSNVELDVSDIGLDTVNILSDIDDMFDTLGSPGDKDLNEKINWSVNYNKELLVYLIDPVRHSRPDYDTESFWDNPVVT